MNVLIVALEAVMPAEVSEAEVLVVAPAVNSRLRRWLSDEDEARRRAEQLARTLVDLLARVGVRAEGRVGDADPLLAIADALPTFPADEIIVAGTPERSRELDAFLLRVGDRFALPVRAADSLATAA
jgi:nucleotide-binding universal stress UspA family protein